jgi:acyl-CoA thioester hydrolase
MKAFIWPVRVYYEDTDAGGVVYHSNYLSFYERARTEMLRALGYEQDWLAVEKNTIFAVRSAQIDFLKPAKFNQLLQVSAQISKLGSASLTFDQTISHADVTLSKAVVRIACLDATNLRPKLILEELKNTFKNEY